jgi:hypothetical protein
LSLLPFRAEALQEFGFVSGLGDLQTAKRIDLYIQITHFPGPLAQPRQQFDELLGIAIGSRNEPVKNRFNPAAVSSEVVNVCGRWFLGRLGQLTTQFPKNVVASRLVYGHKISQG